MKFICLKQGDVLPRNAKDQFYLVHDGWDDWFSFETGFTLYHYDTNCVRNCIGMVKIGKARMREESAERYCEMKAKGLNVSGIRRTILPDTFDSLSDEYFSLGNEDSYYETLGSTAEGRLVLKALNDVAFNQTRYRRYKDEPIMKLSLMRGIPEKRIRDRFAKLAHNKVALTDYEFEYTYPRIRGRDIVKLHFKVSTEPIPPSNIKVIIGRNGVGKTYLLRNIAYSLCKQAGSSNELDDDRPLYLPRDYGKVKVVEGDIYGVVYASFSPLEPTGWEPPNSKIKFRRVGFITEMTQEVNESDGKVCSSSSRLGILKDVAKRLAQKFSEELAECQSDPWRSRFLQCIEILKADPMFAQLAPEDLFKLPHWEMKQKAKSFFQRLSSGHGALLLIVTQLVRWLDEKFLLLIDEPECHLHPPLLALFVNCLSWLLGERNAVAIIATHSPVILQSVVRDSVWIISRFEREIVVRNPEHETFGENVGLLMSDVFGLELDKLGYHRMLSDMIKDGGHSFNEVVSKFGGHLGIEAKAVLRTMIKHQVGD